MLDEVHDRALQRQHARLVVCDGHDHGDQVGDHGHAGARGHGGAVAGTPDAAVAAGRSSTRFSAFSFA